MIHEFNNQENWEKRKKKKEKRKKKEKKKNVPKHPNIIGCWCSLPISPCWTNLMISKYDSKTFYNTERNERLVKSTL